MNSGRPILRLDLLSILAFAFSVLLGLSPAAAQNEDVQKGDVREEDIQKRDRLPKGYPAHQARSGGQVEVVRAPFRNLGEDAVPGVEGRGPRASRTETDPAESNLVMRAAAGLAGGGSTSIADVDGDGNQDLLITGSGANTFPTTILYLGNGQGGFTEADAGLTGVQNGSTSIADVDGDGNQDLLITGYDTNNTPIATLYLGNGQGGFAEADAGLVGVWQSSTSIADVNGDGNQDLLITGNDKSGPVADPPATLYLGDGQGSFTEAEAGLTGVSRGSTSIADVDGDGKKDILITGSSKDGLSTTLYLGDGQGGFTIPNVDLKDVYVSSASISDVDGDGNQDLLITGTDTNNDPSATLYLGDGQGGFTEAGAGLTGVQRGGTSIADIDGDQNKDLLITGRDADLAPTATLYLGNGLGGFTEAGAGLTGVQRGGTSIADLQGDGDSDLFITGGDALFDEASARIYINRQNQSPPNRTPAFAHTFSYDRLLAPGVTLRRTVEAGDLDGDSLSIGLASGPSNISINDRRNGTAKPVFKPTRNQGGDVTQFSVEVSDPSGASTSFSVSVEVSPFVAAFSAGLAGVKNSSTSIADVNGNENPDLLVTGRDANSNPTATLYFGDGQGGFTEAKAGLTEVFYGSTSIADVDGDGNQDLLITGSDADFERTATLYLGDEQGGFTEAEAGLAGVNFGSTSIADVNGDGNQDLLITGRGDSFDPTATLYLGDGQGGFAEAEADLAGINVGSTSFADVNGDGNEDLLITGSDANTSPTTTLYLGNGQGDFAEADAGLAEISGSNSIADVDGDGSQDLLIAGRDANANPTAILYLSDGQGGFSEAGAGLAGIYRYSTSIADIDGDGNQDVLIAGLGENGPSATLYLGDGQGGFTEAGAGLAGVSNGSTSIADIDGDPDPDLLITGVSAASRSESAILYENLFDNPLPVELAGFEAIASGNEVRLSWQTASETGNAGFRVQRRRASGSRSKNEKSRGESMWKTVGRVEGSGTTTETKSYRFMDEDLPYEADGFTYRLKQVDVDGTVSYSKAVTVERGVMEVQLLGTYPNPAEGQATVRYALPETQEVSLRLYDMLGRRVRTVAKGKKEGRHERRVDVSELPSGAYFLRLRSGGTVRTRKLTVVR